jgi:hypothetical protein
MHTIVENDGWMKLKKKGVEHQKSCVAQFMLLWYMSVKTMLKCDVIVPVTRVSQIRAGAPRPKTIHRLIRKPSRASEKNFIMNTWMWCFQHWVGTFSQAVCCFGDWQKTCTVSYFHGSTTVIYNHEVRSEKMERYNPYSKMEINNMEIRIISSHISSKCIYHLQIINLKRYTIMIME